MEYQQKIPTFLITLFFILNATNSICPFDKQIWVYWDQPDNMPLSIKCCYNRFQRFAKENGFKLTLIHDNNIKNYISDYQHFTFIQEHHQIDYKANFADYIRLSILEQNGGIWIDLSTILLQDFGWLDEIEKEQKNIVNKVGSNVANPHALLFYSHYYSLDEWQNNTEGAVTNFQVGYQSWFIAVKKNTPFITQWKKKFQQYYTSSYIQITQDIRKNQIFFPWIPYFTYFRVFYSLYWILQQKQKQLDMKLSLFEGTRQNANVEYKVWGIHCILGPCQIYWKFRWEVPLEILSQYPLYELKLIYGDIRYFVKITHEIRNRMEWCIKESHQYYINNLPLKQFYQKHKKHQNCRNMPFIVQNSILHMLLQQIPELAPQIKVYTIQQRQEWFSYCNKLSPPFQTVFLDQKLQKKFQFMNQWLYWGIYTLVLLGIIKLISEIFLQNYATIKKIVQIPKNLIEKQFKVQIHQQSNISYITSQKQSIFSTKYWCLCVIMEVCMTYIYMACLFRIRDMDYIKNILLKPSLIVCTTLIFQYFVIKLRKTQIYKISQSRNIGLKILHLIRRFNNLVQPIYYFYISKICLRYIQHRPQFMPMYCILFGLVCPLLIRLNQQLLTYNTDSFFRKHMLFIQQKHRFILILVIIFINFFPNSLHLIVSPTSTYLIRNLIFIIIFYMGFLAIQIIYHLKLLKDIIPKYLWWTHIRQFCLLLWITNSFSLYIMMFYHRLSINDFKIHFQTCYILIFAVYYCQKYYFIEKDKIIRYYLSALLTIYFLIKMSILSPQQYYINDTMSHTFNPKYIYSQYEELNQHFFYFAKWVIEQFYYIISVHLALIFWRLISNQNSISLRHRIKQTQNI